MGDFKLWQRVAAAVRKMAGQQKMSGDISPIKNYEIRLIPIKGKVRLFVIAVSDELEAAEYAKVLLLRHMDCESAEVWCGMKLIRQL